MAAIKMKMIELNPEDIIEYKPLHPQYGRAEFVVCPIWKRGKIRELFIFPRQQDRKEAFHLTCESNELNITSWTHEGIEEPKVWLHTWCKEHKTTAIRFYVPNDTDHLQISYGSTLSIYCARKRK